MVSLQSFMGGATHSTWQTEQVFFSGDQFFNAYLEAIHNARESVDFETYIFFPDSLGDRVSQALCGAAKRGVRVRAIVDAVGSSGWESRYGAAFLDAGIEYRVFHRPPWERVLRNHSNDSRLRSIREMLRRFNTRNHGKLLLVDGQQAFLGGMNIWSVHLESEHGAAAWRDTGVRVQGEGLVELCAAYELMWSGVGARARQWLSEWRTKKRLFERHDVLINSFRRTRQRNYRTFLQRIRSEPQRIWITSAYFVPPGSLLRALAQAARRGVDVRVLVPATSDVFFMPWVSAAFYVSLLKANAQLFEYQPRMLHAKSVQGGSWAIVGSSNMNHRSIFHDMEVDVVLQQPSSLDALADQFLQDQSQSHRVSIEDYQARPWWMRALGRVMLGMRFFL